MLVLFETPAGHALFKVLDDAALQGSVTDLESESQIKQVVKLKAFSRFTDTTSALAAATALVESKPSKDLRKFLKKQVSAGEKIAVGDAKLGAAIKDKTQLQCVYSQHVSDLLRAIRCNLETLLDGEAGAGEEASRKAMVLGLAHSLSRYKLKFSPDKVDTMIVQAISLLDELDKEINIYAMRLREWYGWHFPEMGKIVTENAAYAHTVDKMGMRNLAADLDFSDVLLEETEEELKHAAQISMGTEISEEDVTNIRALCAQVISLTEYRATLFEYLRNRMVAIAPNLTAMVGELVGARLISHAGSLLSLAKYPASTVQILGAEKALFRALKTKHATPKYGLIYHASLVGQAAPKHKGKISRSLAAKAALAIRVDALGEAGEDSTVGEQGRRAIEARLCQLEGKTDFAVSRLGRSADKTAKYKAGNGAGTGYNASGDIMMKEETAPSPKVVKASIENGDAEDDEMKVVKENETESSKKKKKKKKDKRRSENGTVENEGKGENEAVVNEEDGDVKLETPKSKKKKKDRGSKSSEKKDKSSKSSEKKEKKKRKRDAEEAEATADDSSHKKKKKKSKSKE
ncbi:Nucleolar protein nop56, putative [Chondrus crispus]|uniref:Nucleolar protein 58 n=1 Tax=Chondrus crispus TaxID=2769 RepID=R7QMG1_CHOCR|nr:Nucleolar protein nop56, putative [Chondrus crispus]CDF39697.1 Nucleolar protein nop56, putative [Chondrus crispus]|eukprot:XP_005709991.1 Nucleolar protein nop56, putative [Chondrus crispus]